MARRRRRFRSRVPRRSRRSRFRRRIPRRRRTRFRKKRGFGRRRRGLRKVLKYLLPKPLNWIKTSTQTIAGQQGLARFWMLEPILDWQDLTDAAGRASQLNITQNGANFQQTVLDHMIKASCHYEILNTSLAHAQIEAFYCYPRKDIPDDQFTRGIHGIPGAGATAGNTIYHIFNRAAQTAWNMDGSATALPGGTSTYQNYYQHPQFQPFMAPEFCKLFKIYKTQRFQLGPGKRVALSLKTRFKKIPSDILQRANTSDSGYSYLRGVGRFILFKVHGQLLSTSDITANAENPSSKLTYATTGFAVGVTKRIKSMPIIGAVKIFSLDMAGIVADSTPITEKAPATVVNEAATSAEATNDGG